MRFTLLSLWLTLAAALAACAGTGGGAQQAARLGLGRTPVPTWTPPFAPASAPEAASATPVATLAPAASATPSPLPLSTVTPRPTNPPTPTPCAEPAGEVSPVSVESGTLRYAIDARVYLPPCYATSGERYPVLYILHGLGYKEDQWERLGLTRAADRLIAAGQIAPLIIVMPRDRLDARLDPAFTNDLVPFIDQTYRTLPDREHRAIGGLSRGAGWAVHLGLHYPEQFGRIGAHSLAIFYTDERVLQEWVRAALKSGLAPAVYLDIGKNDGQPNSARWLDQTLSWFKIEHTYLVQPGSHSEKYWSAHVDDYLLFYAAGWLSQPPTPTPTPPPRE